MPTYKRQRLGQRGLSPGSLEKLMTWDIVTVERLYLKTNCEDLDIIFEVAGRDVGVSLSRLDEYEITVPNRDWYISNIDTTTDPDTYYVVWIPRFTYEDVMLAVKNKLGAGEDRILYEVEVTYLEEYSPPDKERLSRPANITPGGN